MKILMSDRVLVRLGIVLSAFSGALIADDLDGHRWAWAVFNGAVLLGTWWAMWRATRYFSGEPR